MDTVISPLLEELNPQLFGLGEEDLDDEDDDFEMEDDDDFEDIEDDEDFEDEDE